MQSSSGLIMTSWLRESLICIKRLIPHLVDKWYSYMNQKLFIIINVIQDTYFAFLTVSGRKLYTHESRWISTEQIDETKKIQWPYQTISASKSGWSFLCKYAPYICWKVASNCCERICYRSLQATYCCETLFCSDSKVTKDTFGCVTTFSIEWLKPFYNLTTKLFYKRMNIQFWGYEAASWDHGNIELQIFDITVI